MLCLPVCLAARYQLTPVGMEGTWEGKKSREKIEERDQNDRGEVGKREGRKRKEMRQEGRRWGRGKDTGKEEKSEGETAEGERRQEIGQR